MGVHGDRLGRSVAALCPGAIRVAWQYACDLVCPARLCLASARGRDLFPLLAPPAWPHASRHPPAVLRYFEPPQAAPRLP